MYFYNETDTEIVYEMKVPNCLDKDLCTLRLFRQSIENLIIDEVQWKELCELKEGKLRNDNGSKENSDIGMF